MEMTLSHRYLDANLNVLDGIGFPKSEALERLGLREDQLENVSNRFAIEPFLGLIEKASQQLNDPYLGLRMGHKFRIAKFAKTGSIYGYCKDLKQVIDLNSRYQRLAIDVGAISYECDEDGHHMRFRPYYSDTAAFRHITDIIMGAYGTAYRWLSWASGEGLAGVHLPYSAPDCTKLHDRVFQCPIMFNAPSSGASLVLPEAAMSQTLTTYDPERLSRAQAQLDALLGLETAEASLDAAIYAAIRGAIESGRVTTHVVAMRMGREWSDLQADLKSTDRNFRHRVDAVRQKMFIEFYEAGLSFSQISQALAYNDQAAFNRAFKRWHNMSPTDWLKLRETSSAD